MNPLILAREIKALADEQASYSASRGGLEERERCRVAIEEKADALVVFLAERYTDVKETA